jgi:rod shape-determining protein MreB
MIKSLVNFFRPAIAVDLGTSTTLIYLKGKGIVLREPSVVAIDANTKKVVAVGWEAKRMLGKAHEGLIVKRPIRDGVINNLELVQYMLYEFKKKAIKNVFSNPTIIMAVPSGANDVERKASIDAAKSIGASQVYLIEEPVASAIGIGLQVFDPKGYLIVDIGGGTSEIALVSLGGVVYKYPIKTAGDEMDEAIADYIRKNFNILIDEYYAEKIKIEIGDVYGENKMEMVIQGWDIYQRKPKEVLITSDHIREALEGVINELVNAIRKVLESASPSLVQDVLDEGIYLTGGGSTIRGLDKRLEKETGIKFIRASNPYESVISGAGKVLEEIENGNTQYYKLVLYTQKPV